MLKGRRKQAHRLPPALEIDTVSSANPDRTPTVSFALRRAGRTDVAAACDA